LYYLTCCYRKAIFILLSNFSQKNQRKHGKYQMASGVTLAFSNPGPGEMASDPEGLKELGERHIKIGEGFLEGHFDLPLKGIALFVIHKEAPFLWFV
jgi:hypothetical protein